MRAPATILLLWLGLANAASPPHRILETVVPALEYGPACSSTITLRNLADRPMVVEVEGHRSDGALAPFEDRPGMRLKLAAGESAALRLRIEDSETDAWVRVREPLDEDGPPRIAVSGSTACQAGNQLREVSRRAAYPMHSPWYSEDAGRRTEGAVILLVNAAPKPARAKLCASAAGYYTAARKGGEVEYRPVCSSESDVQIPPFGARRFALADYPGSLRLRTSGDAIVLQMLRPLDEANHVFVVDSTIRFGEEVTPKP